MKYIYFFFFSFLIIIKPTLSNQTEKTLSDSLSNTFSEKNDQLDKTISERMYFIDKVTPIQLAYNPSVHAYIQKYLFKEKSLISKMQGISEYYFPLFEQMLDKYNLPMELKYLPIVESSLNPQARSSSGASGLWQFMYLTGKQYNLEVSSYVDDRQNPIKSTEAACQYFVKLYDIFGDWNLVLAAYNGGPGYIQRKVVDTGIKDFWKLKEHLRQETRNYIPKFIAINYVMSFSAEYGIKKTLFNFTYDNLDTVLISTQIDLKTLSILTCLKEEEINHLNPSYKRNIFPSGSRLILPKESVMDFLLNEESNYIFAKLINQKQVLINEKRITYHVVKGDYLGKIAKNHNLYIHQIKNWNNLKSNKIQEGDKLVLFISKELHKKNIENLFVKKEYIIQKGDTLWDIARKLDGVSVAKIKSLNNLESDHLKPGTKIFIPAI
tara:strand:- start:369 stop:1679 length:1311 start_codon:yes stop_codon:yes gene_type:complete